MKCPQLLSGLIQICLSEPTPGVKLFSEFIANTLKEGHIDEGERKSEKE